MTPTAPPIPHHTFHWLAVSDTHIALDEAVRNQKEVLIDGWINEWDVVNKETSPGRRSVFSCTRCYRSIPAWSAFPMAQFLASFQGTSKVFYLEQDRATSGALQIASSKTPGYAAMAEKQLHRRHFPKATLDQFSVLMVAPSPKRRDSLRYAIRGKPGANLWRFAACQDFVPAKLLCQAIYYTCDGDEPKPLLRRD